MEKREEEDLGDPEKAFEEINNETPLNLTDEADHGEEDPKLAAEIQANYEKFMNEMKNLQFDENEDLGDFNGSISNLLKGLGEAMGLEGAEGEELKGMFEGQGANNIEAIAGKLLECFMNKDLLYAPLLECRTNYQEFFKREEGKTSPEDNVRFQKQFAIINRIIDNLEQNPNDKDKLMQLFEEMQEYGQPPNGIASVTLPNTF